MSSILTRIVFLLIVLEGWGGGVVIALDFYFIRGVNKSCLFLTFVRVLMHWLLGYLSVLQFIVFMRNFCLLIIILLSFTSFSADYYWVGGFGNWSEINHWATTSGGTNYHTVVPSLNDDVYFDANSGVTSSTVVVLNQSVQSCHSFNASISMTLEGVTNSEFRIYGSFMTTGMVIINVQKVSFLSDEMGNTIFNFYRLGNGLVTFEGDGSWEFSSRIQMPNVNFVKGTILTNGNQWDVYRFDSTGSGVRSLNIENSQINFKPLANSSSSYSTWTYSGTNCNLSAQGSHLYSGFYGRSVVSLAEGHVYDRITISSNGEGNSIFGLGRIKRLQVNCNILFSSNGIFTVDTVIFTQNYKYTFSYGCRLRVTSIFSAERTDCSSSFEFKGALYNGSNSEIIIEDGAQIQIDGALISSLHFISSNPILATNSIDDGGNLGVDFQSGTPITYYWVGGSGDWSDRNHWSLNNDGVYPASSQVCIPTLIDNVIFNENSTLSTTLFSVTVRQVGSIYVTDFTVIGLTAPMNFASTNIDLFIAGSLDVSSEISFNTKEIHFISDVQEQTIRSGGNDLKKMRIQGTGGYTLLDDLKVRDMITVYEGTFNTDGYRVEANSIQSNGVSGGYINLGSSEVFLYKWFVGSNITVVAGTSTINFNGEFIGSAGQSYYHVRSYLGVNNSPLPSFRSASGFVIVQKFFGESDCQFSNANFDTLLLNPGFYFSFIGNVGIRDLWHASSIDCTSSLYLIGSSGQITVQSGCVVDLEYARISNLHVIGQVPINTINAIDLGDNTGIVFGSVPSSRTLYWVGGGGDWNDSRHWSLNNDGVYPSSSPTCSPTLFDDVVFNENSGFDLTNRNVGVNYNTIYCRDFSVSNINAPIQFNYGGIKSYGSIDLQDSIGSSLNVSFYSNSPNLYVRSAGNVLDGQFYGTSVYELLDDSKWRGLTFYKGGIITNGFKVEVSTVLAGFFGRDFHLDISGSKVFVQSRWEVISNGYFIGVGSEVVTNGTFISSANHHYNRVIVDNDNNRNFSLTGPFTANYVELNINASILRNNIFDTLVLSSGKTYQFESGSEQIIHDRLYASGTPCEVIFVSSTINGSPAFLTVQGGDRTYDYARVKDINASRSVADAIFESHSVDLGGNTNIDFIPYNANEPITGFGPDMQVVCPFVPFTLGTEGFYGGPATKYLWNDGSTADSLVVTDFGVYHVEVLYSTGCTVIDSMVITPILDTIPPSITGCPQDIFMQSDAGMCEAVASWIPPVASDNCVSNLEITATHQPGGVFEVGETNVVYTFSDGAHSSTCEFKVTVENNRAPIFYDCPDTLRAVNAPGLCGNEVVWVAPLATDGCSMDSILSTSNYVSGDFFPVGETTIVYTSYGVNGDSITCSFVVQVLDVEDPVILLSDLNMLVCKGQVVTWTVEAIDNCGIDTVFTSHISGSIFPVGLTIVTVTAIDLSGNESLYTFEVTVQDSPSISLSTPSELEVCLGGTAYVQVDNPQPGVLYLWSFDGEFIAVGSRIMKEDVAYADTGLYVVTTESFIGCQASSQVRLNIVECGIFIPESFSPNGDGVNDYFVIPAVVNYPNSKLWVNDRWGVQVFESDDYQNNWDGHSNSKITVSDGVLPEGTYYYILELGVNPIQVNSGEIFKGFVYLKP